MELAPSPSLAWSSSIALDKSTASARLSKSVDHEKAATTATTAPPFLTASRFWADFTLGFADGLTVPFALTAGLSSLGRTDTVVYAGLAEVSAGCISMGIGGYLSATQASRASSTDAVAALGLPADLEKEVLKHVKPSPADTLDTPPVVSGLSVAVGYLVGGILPLWPYFFVAHVGDGLRWSVAVCIVALFVFGYLQALYRENGKPVGVWACVGGGLQMVTLCGIASLAAVLCVYLFEGQIEEGGR